MACWRRKARASRIVVPLGRHSGCSTTNPWLRLTCVTSRACPAILMPRWIKPMPPSSARVLAMAASVTLSMFADTTGSARVSCRVRRAVRPMSRRERTTPSCGRTRKSS